MLINSKYSWLNLWVQYILILFITTHRNYISSVNNLWGWSYWWTWRVSTYARKILGSFFYILIEVVFSMRFKIFHNNLNKYLEKYSTIIVYSYVNFIAWRTTQKELTKFNDESYTPLMVMRIINFSLCFLYNHKNGFQKYY